MPLLAGMAVGVVPAMLYATLIGGLHRLLHGRWDRVPIFVAVCLPVGALIGLLGGAAWLRWSESTPEPRAGARQ
jgi:hypothetical protein